MKKILVCGGAGYIGSHTCKALAEQGYDPVVLDDFSQGRREFVQWGNSITADLRDARATEQALRDVRPDAVAHFASLIAVGESTQDPLRYYQNNLTGTLNLLAAMHRVDCRKIVFSSSAAVYGEPTVSPITESARKEPINPYGRSKWMVEQILDDADFAYGIKSVRLRYFNAAGADAQARIGEAHEPETHLIPLILQTAAGARAEIEVFGTDYSTRDGTCIRDYVHVDDLAQAHLLALKYLDTGAGTLSCNLGSEQGFSVREVLVAAEKITAHKIKIKETDRRPGDPPVLIADSSLAKRKLGWAPKSSDLETILSSAWKWYLKNASPRT